MLDYLMSPVDIYKRGDRKRSSGDYRGAISDLNKAMEKGYPFLDDAFLGRASCKLALSDLNGATEDAVIAVSNSTLVLFETSIPAYGMIVLAQEKLGHHAEAVSAAQIVLDLYDLYLDFKHEFPDMSERGEGLIEDSRKIALLCMKHMAKPKSSSTIP